MQISNFCTELLVSGSVSVNFGQIGCEENALWSLNGSGTYGYKNELHRLAQQQLQDRYPCQFRGPN